MGCVGGEKGTKHTTNDSRLGMNINNTMHLRDSVEDTVGGP